MSTQLTDRKRPGARRRMLDAVSAIEAPFHGSGGFYLRVSGIGLVAIVAFGVLALRLWSLQVLRGPHFATAAAQQSYRVVELPAPRGAIVDAHGRVARVDRGAARADRRSRHARRGRQGAVDADRRGQPRPRPCYRT